MTPAEFLAWESEQSERHDFVGGEIFSMAGGTLEHSAGALAVAFALKTHLKGSSCRVSNSDVQVRVESEGEYVYPDISVTCSATDVADPAATFIAEPRLIVEVLSPSAAAYDRGDKFASLRKLASLQEYALLDVSTPRLEVFRRNAHNRWELFESTSDQSATQFESIGRTGVLSQLLS
jgi:Uma2 family endonuclease